MTIRRYHWQTDRPKEQLSFLLALLKVYRTYTKGQSPELINFPPPPESRPPPSSSGSSESISTSQNGHGAYDGHLSPTSPQSIPQNIDLRPPQLHKSQRSGSSSSFNSAQSSSYQSENGQIPRGRYGDQQHTPRADSFSRSPLADPGIPPARTSFERRPSGDNRLGTSNGSTGRITPGASAPSPYTQGNGSGLGLGVPSRRDDRPLAPHREASEASTYLDRPDQVRRPSIDRVKQPSRPTSPASPERPARPSRAAARLSRDMSDSGTPTPRAHTPQPSLDRKESHIPPPIQSQLAPTITTTLPSPALPSHDTLSPNPLSAGSSESGREHRRPQRRASFHPPPLETAFSREVLLTSRTGLLPGAGLTVDDGDSKEDAIMASVEEMLEGFDWTAPSMSGEGGTKKSGADAIEGRLLDELAALDSVSPGLERLTSITKECA